MDVLITDTTVVWANSSSTAIEHPLTGAILWPGNFAVRVSIELNHPVGDLEITGYYELSYDGFTWGNPDEIGPTTTMGVEYGTAYEPIGQSRPYVRFGVKAINGSTSNLNLGYASLRIEFKRC